MMAEALAIMPRSLSYMYLGGHLVLSSSNFIDYIFHILPWSYGAAWNVLTDIFAPPVMLKTDVVIPVSML